MSIAQCKHIVVGISGGIAAYKTLSLIRLFKSRNYEVKVVATENALQFVTRLTLETLSQNSLYYNTFNHDMPYQVEHISLSEWADLVIVAPATANIIGKFAHGIADDALSTFLLAANCPIYMAPAMNNQMINNVAVQENLTILKKRGIHIIEPRDGFLACGSEGKGRMEEPEHIFELIHRQIPMFNRWKNTSVLITAGPTFEAIDPVRFIGNHSSGLMGFQLAEVLAEQGASVTLITGPTHLKSQNGNINRIDITTAQQMFDQCTEHAPQAQVIIMAAAVADYTPSITAPEKIKKKEESWSINVVKTKDILAQLGKNKTDNQYLIGFALETENEILNAKQKLHNKNADLIVLNSMRNKGSGFNTPTNQVTLISKEGEEIPGYLKSKREVAEDIVNYAYEHFLKKRF